MDNLPTSHNEVMNADEAASFLKMPKSTLLKLTSEGQIPGVKVGRGWRFNLTALENWKNASSGDTAEDSSPVEEPVEVNFNQSIESAERRLESTIKPVVEEVVEPVGDFEFDSVGEVRELEEEEVPAPAPKQQKKPSPIPESISEGLGEVRELDDEPEKPVRGRPAKSSAVRTASALELMARISGKSADETTSRLSKAKTPPSTLAPKRRGRPPRNPSPETVETPKSLKTPARESSRETARETMHEATRETIRETTTLQDDAVEISRPYNPAASLNRPDFSAKKKPSASPFSLLRKISYWVLVLVVLGLAAFGIKGLLVPPTTEPQVASLPQQLPSLPEFNDMPVVYRHNDTAQPGQDNFNMPTPPPAPLPEAIAETPTTPDIVALATPGQLALQPIPESERPQPATPIATQPTPDRSLESINRILPALFDLSGCSINSSNNEIRIVFQEGIFSSGVNIGSEGRNQLARVAEFLNANAPDFWLIIEGQTDSEKVRPKSPFRDNFTLGLRRAIEATTVMREEGNFPAERLLAKSAGGLAPPFPENQPGAASRNRTVILRLIPKSSPLPSQTQ